MGNICYQKFANKLRRPTGQGIQKYYHIFFTSQSHSFFSSCHDKPICFLNQHMYIPDTYTYTHSASLHSDSTTMG